VTPPSDSSSLPAWAIAGLVVGVLLVLSGAAGMIRARRR
jgi:hypothetical protein